MPPLRFGRGWLFYAAAPLILAVLWNILPLSPGLIEAVYSRHIYRFIGAVIVPVTGAIPFSAGICLILLGGAGFLFAWIFLWVGRRKEGYTHWQCFLWAPKWGLVAALWIYIVFVAVWGAGYRRPPVEDRLDLKVSPVTHEEAQALRGEMLAVIKKSCAGTEKRDIRAALLAIEKAMRQTVSEWEGKPVVLPGGVKATFPGLLLVNNTAGVCIPLTLEPHIDGALPPAAFIGTAAHELAHIAGYCREAEATFLGYAAGLRAENDFARYAVALSIYRDLMSLLPKEERAAAWDALPKMAQSDLKAAQETFDRYRIRWFADASQKAYDKYLKSQGIEEGIKNYNRGITLYAALWRKNRE